MRRKGKCGPIPRASSSNLGPLSSPPHPGLTITSLFQQKGGEGGRKAGVCLFAAVPAPLCGPLPFQTGNQPRFPASCSFAPPPPQAHGVTLLCTARRALRLRPGSSSELCPKAELIPGAASAHRPLLLVPGSRPSLPHAGPKRGCLRSTDKGQIPHVH